MDTINSIDWKTVSGILAVIFAIIKFIFPETFSKKPKKSSVEYRAEVAKEFFDQYYQKNKHPLEFERAVQKLFQNRKITASEADYFIRVGECSGSFLDMDLSVSQYTQMKKSIVLPPHDVPLEEIRLAKNLDTLCKRVMHQFGYLLLYFFFALVAIIGLSELIVLIEHQWAAFKYRIYLESVIGTVWVIFWAMLAWLQLNNAMNVGVAEQLVARIQGQILGHKVPVSSVIKFFLTRLKWAYRGSKQLIARVRK